MERTFFEIIFTSTILVRKRKMMYYIFAVIIIIIITIYLSSKRIEKFANDTNNTILVDNSKNVKGSKEYDKELFHQLLLIISKGYIASGMLSILGLLNMSNIKLYVDPYVKYYILNNTTESSDYNDGIFMCLSPKKLDATDCIWNMENKVVAYNYISDYLFVQAIIKAYRQDISKITLVKISDKELIEGKKTFDFFITYAVLGSDYLKFLERSLYYISGLNDVDIHRIKAFYPFVHENYKSMREYFNNDLMKEYISEKNSLAPIMRYKIMDFNARETFITRLSQSTLATLATSRCFGNEHINNQYECDSPFNYDGTPKRYYSTWDKFCQKDEDCPYYKANTNYANKRGGCNEGICELPVGVKRIAYTQIEDTGLNAPLCYECTNMLDFDCCKRQKKPDYVFANDYKERLNMKTIVDKLDIYGY